MKIIAVNGSPRKNWNTHILLTKALDGAKTAGSDTELINLYDLTYKGCVSCMACKIKNGPSLGRCAINDDLKPLLNSIHKCDGLVLGSPIYFSDITGMMRSFLERLFFQYLSYDDYTKPLYKGNIKTAFIYTMNVPESALTQIGYTDIFNSHQSILKRFFKSSTYMTSTETLQVNDYDKYHMAQFSEPERKKRREQIFPQDCQKAHDLGKELAAYGKI